MKKIAVDGEKMALVLWILLLLAIVILNGMVGDWGRLAGGPDNLIRFFFQSLWPPDMSVLEPQTYPVCTCLLYTSPSPRDAHESRMPSSA